jgi:ATP-binding cassette subfamily F protein uup
VSHDRDFIDRLATSTIGLDGTGRAVETPGGWQDFVRQNPGFFEPPRIQAPRATPAKAPPLPKPAGKLSYKDQRRLEQLERDVADLPGRIAALDADQADPQLYARDPSGFDRLGRALADARSQLAAAEEEWLALEEQRESLESGR